MRITPTVGRIVLYRKSTNDTDLASRGNQPLAAIIACVWSDTMVNLHVIDANGVGHARQIVRLVQEGDEIREFNEAYAFWMPYQRGQAAKNDDDIAKLTVRIDALEAALANLAHQEISGTSDIRIPQGLTESAGIESGAQSEDPGDQAPQASAEASPS